MNQAERLVCKFFHLSTGATGYKTRKEVNNGDAVIAMIA